jgi:hypothetical protein
MTVAVFLGPGMAAAADPTDITLDLNKLEPGDKGCRAYMVIDNRAEIAYYPLSLFGRRR